MPLGKQTDPVADWKPYENRVQGGLRDGNFVNGQFILLCAGPPYFEQLNASDSLGGGMLAYPIGLTQNLSISQNKSVTRIFEIGSDRSYFIPGRAVGQLTLGRVVYHGPSLLRVLWATYGLSDPNGVQIPPLVNSPQGIGIEPYLATDPDLKKGEKSASGPALHQVQVPPGYDNMFLNLASDLFNNPMGLMLIMKDSEQNMMAAAYFENCYVPSHSLAVDAQGLIMQESVGIQYERLRPISVVPRVSLIQGVLHDEFGLTKGS